MVRSRLDFIVVVSSRNGVGRTLYGILSFVKIRAIIF